jgi:thiosulfate dehydrogenase [quinone] large subunit
MAILRIGVGAFFAVYGVNKVFSPEFTRGGGYEGAMHGFIASGAEFPFMLPIINNTFLPFAQSLAFVVAYGELLIGLSLIFGCLSRTASTFGFVLMILLWLSGGYPGPHSPFWSYVAGSENWTVLALCFLAFVLGNPEERLSIGLGGLLKRRRSTSQKA